MNNLSVIELLLVKATEKRKISKRTLMKSYISLFLAFSILAVTTFSWFTMNDTATVTSSAVEVSASSGLRVNQGEDLSSNIVLSADVKLAEASSVDGRNIFFPTTGTFPDENSNAENKMDTSKMIFREGNVGDKNTKYYYNNFSMQVESDNTEVYVKSYSVTVTTGEGENKKTQVFDGSVRLDTNEAMRNPEECPIRIAFIQDSSQTPVVIDPTAFVSNYAKEYTAVSSINSEGEPSTASSSAEAFSSYYFGANNPLFKVEKAGQSLDATMVIWLEGTGGNCDRYVGGTVEVDIQLESNWKYMETIKFIDETLKDEDEKELPEDKKYWVDDTDCIVVMTYIDARTKKNKAVIMSQSSDYNSDHTWIAALPEDVTENINFMRYNPHEETIWNAWYTRQGINDTNFENPLTDDLRSWTEYKAQPLQENRFVTEDNKTYRSVIYKAIRGNGHGVVQDNDPDKAKKRQTPCLGYWIVDQENNDPIDQTSDWYLTGSFNNWTDKDSNYQFIAGTNKYTLTKELAAGTYTFKLYDDKNTGGKYFAQENASFDNTANNLSLVQSDSKDSGYMTLNADGGRYTFEIDVSNPQNYKLTVSYQTTSQEEREITFIIQDDVDKYNEKQYQLELSSAEIIDMGSKIQGGEGQSYKYEKKVKLAQGVTIAKIHNVTESKSFDISDKTFKSGTYTAKFVSYDTTDSKAIEWYGDFSN